MYIVCANEVQGDLDRELALIKEFSTGDERVRFIEEVFDESLKGSQQLKEYMYIAFSLYRDEINRILSKKGVNMTIVEKISGTGLINWVLKKHIRKKRN